MDWTVCEICSLRIRVPQYLSHIIQYHKSDRYFQIQCRTDGCGQTYKKWKSFVTHHRRVHSNIQNNPRYDGNVDVPMEEGNISNHSDNEPMEEDIVHNDEVGGNQAPHIDGEKLLKWHTSKNIIGLKESTSMPQRTLSKVVDVIEDVISETLNMLKEMLVAKVEQETGSVRLEDIEAVFSKFANISMVEDVSTIDRINAFLRHHGIVEPKKIILGKRRVWTTGRSLAEIEDHAYIVPFLDNLELLLNNPDFLKFVDNPKHYDGVIRTVTDGTYYRSRFVAGDLKTLSVIFYFDDVEVTNPLSAKTVKLSMFYVTFGNIPPEFRSLLQAIYLVAICTSENLKRYGAVKVLEDFLSAMVKLGREAGLKFKINGIERVFHGILNFVSGDTPASGFLSGFKEGVGGASKPCRTCRTDSENMQLEFSESQVVLRDLLSHNADLNDLLAPGLSKRQKAFLSTITGVNSKSAFLDVPNADVTQIFPHDIMHVIFEGVLSVEIVEFLKYCLTEEMFTLENFNDALKSFDYGHLSTDKPQPIDAVHLENGLRQGAANMKALGHVLPFIVSQWVGDYDAHMINFVRLLQIVNLSCAFEHTEECVDMLRRMIYMYLQSFKDLYPTRNLTPKMHFLIHLPSQILKFGPLRQQSCFRFEGAHAYYKDLIRKLRNYTNVPLTLSTRRQSKMASDLLPSLQGVKSKGFLRHDDEVSKGKQIEMSRYEFGDELKELLRIQNGDNTVVLRVRSFKTKGTELKSGSVIVLSCDVQSLPSFGRIQDIIVHDGNKIIVYNKLKSCEFSFRYNAYRVEPMFPPSHGCLNVRDLIFCHPLSMFRCQSKNYVVLFDSNRIEFDG